MDGNLEEDGPERGYRYFDWKAGKSSLALFPPAIMQTVFCLDEVFYWHPMLARKIRVNKKSLLMFKADDLNNDDKSFLNQTLNLKTIHF